MSLGIVHRVEDVRHQWAGDPRSARKRQPVDPLYDRLRRIERTFHSVDDVAYEFVIHVKLPVSEELHQTAERLKKLKSNLQIANSIRSA